ncbi:glycosyltransferase 87 family protein [Streptomyces sp. NPDC014734]|uniref:glycosyltransferase 87 family protein n=1 Tax=Streptomyces sp. NPDC014734 TaxID=3364886 RepID=UPI0037010229
MPTTTRNTRTRPDPTHGSVSRLRRWDWPVLLVSAVSALAVGLSSPSGTGHEAWGLIAAVGYTIAALAAVVSATPWARVPAVIAAAGSALAPLLYLVAIDKAQMEVGVVERSADLLVSSGTAYNAAPHVVPDFDPYLPGMSVFGLPHVMFGDTPFTSARLWFVLGFLAAVLGAVRVLTGGRGDGAAGARRTVGGIDAATGVFWLLACPVVALPLTTGGVDPPIIGLICLALAFAERRNALGAGLALGAAAALKWTAWPALPVIVAMFAVCCGRRAAVKCAGVAVGIAVLCTVPVALVNIDAFYRNVILYPLGLGEAASTAQSPLLGHLIVTLVPHGRTVTVALIALSALGVGVSLLVRPPRTPVAAADRLAYGLFFAIALSPATRIGYAIFPVVLFVWPRFAARLAAGRPGSDADAGAEEPGAQRVRVPRQANGEPTPAGAADV